MTGFYMGMNNFIPRPFVVEMPQSFDAGLLYSKKDSANEENNSEGNKILDFKTGKFIDYNEYLLKNAEFDINCLA